MSNKIFPTDTTVKATLVAADQLLIADSADSNKVKDITGTILNTFIRAADGDISMADGEYIGIPSNERIVFNAAGTIDILGAAVGIGLAPLTNMVVGDMLLEGGSLVLKEITTPTADANYGKLYCKSDDKLYFQDGAGAEHTVSFGGGGVAYDDIGYPDANSTIAFTGYTNTWTSTLNGGDVFTISNTVADLTVATTLLALKYTDDGDADGSYINCLDNSGADSKFKVVNDGRIITGGAETAVNYFLDIKGAGTVNAGIKSTNNSAIWNISRLDASDSAYINLQNAATSQFKFGMVAAGTQFKFQQQADYATVGSLFEFGAVAAAELTNTNGQQEFLAVKPLINQSATAGYTALEIDVTETATGSGTKNLMDLQVGGTSIYTLSNDGTMEIAAANATLLLDATDASIQIDRSASSRYNSIYFRDGGANKWSIGGYANTALSFLMQSDVAEGDGFVFRQATAGSEFTDTNAHQSVFMIGTLEILQTDTAGYTALDVNIVESSLGSGTNSLFNLQISSTSKFRIDNTGGIFPAGMKSGTDQADAGAAAGELYSDTNDDNTVKIGV